jgi:GTP cyclohydrolase I
MNRTIKDLIRELLPLLNENPDREGLIKTPKRVEESLKFLTQGYNTDLNDVLNDALFEEECNEMVIVRNIEVFSMCEHHLLPFYGSCHVAYLPNGKIIGLSKIPRMIDVFARRLQVQERMTKQIADTLWEILKPLGVAVVMEARHLCMMMRGVDKQNTNVITSAMLGDFKSERLTRMELLSLLQGSFQS